VPAAAVRGSASGAAHGCGNVGGDAAASGEGSAVIRRLWQGVQGSYWFVPTLMAAGALALSMATMQADRYLVAEEWELLPERLLALDVASARAFLVTVAGSMITVAGVVFSITMVALTLASSQYGPRLLGNFMRDRGNQVVLGTFLATFLYCLLVLRVLVGFGEQGDTVPEVSLLTALALTLGSLAVLIYFFHHAATSIQVANLVASIGRDLDRSLERLFPATVGEPAAEPPEALRSRLAVGALVRAPRRGYLAVVEAERLMEVAVEHDLVVEVLLAPGRFAVEGRPLARVVAREPGRGAGEAPLGDAVLHAVRRAFHFGRWRTLGQDAEFAVHELVELAVRALSAGINDPFTAVQCVDLLGDALCRLARREPPQPWRADAAGRLRVIAPAETFPDLLAAAYDPIRQYARGHAAVTVRLLERLADVAACTPLPADARRAVRDHADKLRRCAEALPEPTDREAVEERYGAVVGALSGTTKKAAAP
jgi:uncharacterized membrane protein